MKKEDCVIGARVKYIQGIRAALIGLIGTVESDHDYNVSMVIVHFDNGYTFACYVGNLELV